MSLGRILCLVGLHHWWVARIGTGDGGAIYIHSCAWCRAKTWTYRKQWYTDERKYQKPYRR